MDNNRKPRQKSFAQLGAHERITLCKAFNNYISVGATGTLEDMAGKFGISETTAIEVLAYMIEELQCPINYSQSRKTYFYKGDGKLLLGFTPVAEL
jgi:hypothetical protein